ncbi:uncharacterized protein LOC143831643 isoform X2 [Paroedura picta]
MGRRQRVLYKNIMQANSVASLGGFPVSTAELLTRLERGEEAWVPDLHSSDESADEGPVKPTLKRLPKGGMWWGRYRSPVAYPSSDSSASDNELESEAEEEKPQRGGQKLMFFHRNLLASSRGSLKQRDGCKNGAQLKKHLRSPAVLAGESSAKERTSAGDCQNNACSDCGQSFKSKLSLSNHLRKHTREKPYSCSRCGERFSAKKALAAHQMSHAEAKGYKYPSGMKTTAKLQMVPPKEGPYKCTLCEKTFKAKDHLAQHEKMHNAERPYRCPVCKRGFSRKEHLNRHQNIHRRQEDDPPPEATKAAKVEKSTVAPKNKPSVDPERTIALNTRHQRFSVSRFKCQFCGRCMRAKALLVDHERSHREERRYKCSHCNKSFYQKHPFEKHKALHLRRQQDGRSPKRTKRPSKDGSPSGPGNFHRAEDPSESPAGRKIITRSFHRPRCPSSPAVSKAYECQYCGKHLSARSSLVNHERLHRGEKPYKCQDCGERFYRKHHLGRHLLTHTSGKPLKHSQNGGRQKGKSSLPVLGGIQTGQRRSKASIRDRIVTRNARFAGQPAIRTEERLYKCQFCEKVLRTKNSLLIHERSHRGAGRYACPDCGKEFSQKNYLSCHRRSHTKKKGENRCPEADKNVQSPTAENASLPCRGPQGRKLRYRCLKCGKKFEEKYYFTRHQIIHTGTKPFKCVTCGKGFIQTWHLKRHEKTHLKARQHKQLVEPEGSQLFVGAARGISSGTEDQRDPPENISKQSASRTEERNISPDLKRAKLEPLAAFDGAERGASHGLEQGDVPTAAEIESQASPSGETKRNRSQNPKEAEAKNDLSQQGQPRKPSKKISLQSHKNEKVGADWPLELQANAVRKSQRETHLAGKQCRSCFCQQEEPGAAPGRKSKNSQGCMKTKTYTSPQRQLQANVSSGTSKRALKHCKPRKAWLDQQSQLPLLGEPRMKSHGSPAVGNSACVEQQKELGKKVPGRHSSGRQASPRLSAAGIRNSCQETQAAKRLSGAALQDSASAKRPLNAQPASVQTTGKQRKRRAPGDQQERRTKRKPDPRAPEKGVAVSQGKSEKRLFQHRCTECKKSFRSQANLVIHKKYHRGHRPFHCAQCKKSFYALTTLNVHVRIHTGEKPYKCTECPFRCNVSSNLSRHKRTHARQRPQACHLCDERFWSHHSLQEHLETHLDEEPYKCSDCGRVFTQENFLKLHRRFKHSPEVGE